MKWAACRLLAVGPSNPFVIAGRRDDAAMALNASRNIGLSTTFCFRTLNVAGSCFTKRSHGTRAIARSLCFGRTFDRPPARAGNPDTDSFNRAAAFTHGFGLYVRESVADKTDQHGEREAVCDPEQPGASAPLRFIQHFECAALLRAEGYCHCLPVRLSRSGRSFQFGRASLPMMRLHLHTTRGPNAVNNTRPGRAST